ncbi:MAG: hypothetical protein JW395_0275 [Nitrospira sp.]|nr:hypothetical protein [Nitrospira sp.]
MRANYHGVTIVRADLLPPFLELTDIGWGIDHLYSHPLQRAHIFLIFEEVVRPHRDMKAPLKEHSHILVDCSRSSIAIPLGNVVVDK